MSACVRLCLCAVCGCRCNLSAVPIFTDLFAGDSPAPRWVIRGGEGWLSFLCSTAFSQRPVGKRKNTCACVRLTHCFLHSVVVAAVVVVVTDPYRPTHSVVLKLGRSQRVRSMSPLPTHAFALRSIHSVVFSPSTAQHTWAMNSCVHVPTADDVRLLQKKHGDTMRLNVVLDCSLENWCVMACLINASRHFLASVHTARRFIQRVHPSASIRDV